MVEIEGTYRIAYDDHRTLADYLLYRRHLFAYEEVFSRLCENAVVADVGCGYGYALELLGRKAGEIYAIDAADTALQNLPDLPKVKKIKAFADSIPLDSESVDCVIAFQLLEHLQPESVVATLKEFLRILRAGGHIYATTPNAKWRLFSGQKPWNPYHTKEYTADELNRLCGDVLPNGWQLKSVVGRGEAQQIEIARAAPNPMKHFGPSLRGYVLKAWQYIGPTQVARWRKRGRMTVDAEHLNKDWFELSSDPAEGLDLWLEVNKS
ncbi:MAG: class I SAM-dependent methyltransferase [Planctomycetes bacterium]|nr:class I SAM-dependent methyltransferase [Planctomycetota bacterium]